MGKLQQLKQMKQSINIITNPSEIIVGIVDPNDEVNVVIEPVSITDDVIEHVWKTLPSGKQIMVRSGDAGALNGNDMRKIDIAVKAAIDRPYDVDRIRNGLIDEFSPSDANPKHVHLLKHGMNSWVLSGSGTDSTDLAIANNVMKSRKRDAGISPNQLSHLETTGKRGNFPQDNMLKTVNAYTVFNRGMAKNEFGDKPFAVYRGISGKQAETILSKAKKGDTIRIDSNTLSSWTTNTDVAKKFASRKGIVIKGKASYKNVFDGWPSNSVLKGFEGERELILSTKGMKMTGVIM
jgi:hypothetical protein